MAVENIQVFPDDIDTVINFNATKPLYVDYKSRAYYYIFCTENVDLDAGQYGTLHLQASVWYEMPIEQGTRLIPVGVNPSSPQNFTFITRATNKSYTPIPPPLQFDISNITRTSSGTLLGPIGVPYYKLAVMQLTGAWTGNVIPFQSIDGVTANYTSSVFTKLDDTTQARAITATVSGIYRVPLIGRYVRFDVTALTGTITASFIFFMNSVDI